VFPLSKDIIGDWIDVVVAILATIVVVVTTGETVVRRVAGEVFIAVDILIHIGDLVVSLTPGLGDEAPHHVLPLQLAHVVNHLAVKVRVVKCLTRSSYRTVVGVVQSVSTRSYWSWHFIPRRNRHGPVSEWCGRVPGEEGG